MKKLSTVILTLLFTLCFFGCTDNETVKIDEYTWSMVTVQSLAQNGGIVAYNPENITEDENIYTDAKTSQIILTAQKGKLTLKTDNKAYEGTYKTKKTEYGTVIYDVNIDGNEGNAVVSYVISSKGERYITLILSSGDYTVNFQAQI